MEGLCYVSFHNLVDTDGCETTDTILHRLTNFMNGQWLSHLQYLCDVLIGKIVMKYSTVLLVVVLQVCLGSMKIR